MNYTKFLIILLIFSILTGCGGKEFKKNPVDLIVKDLPTTKVFSIILNDMDIEGTFFKKYKHQYKIIKEREAGNPEEYISGWYEVDETFFKRNTQNMGMEIVSRGEDGKLNKSASPPGYNNYVGNERYGSWQTNNSGGSFWAFYGQYAFMSSMFNMMAYPVRRSYYNDYRTNYYGTRRTYYGPKTNNGTSYYGTNSKFSQSTNSRSRWSSKNSSFKNRVAGRTSRSSSRYGGLSSRSRGRGFGK